MRIRLAHRLGIIDHSLASALEIFRRIRNEFAHTFEGQRLQDPPHRDRTDTVIGPVKNNLHIAPIREAVRAGTPGIDLYKLDFVMASGLAIAKLEIVVGLIDRVKDDRAKIAKYP